MCNGMERLSIDTVIIVRFIIVCHTVFQFDNKIVKHNIEHSCTYFTYFYAKLYIFYLFLCKAMT